MIAARSTRQAVRHQAAGSTERWLYTGRSSDALATERLARQSGAASVDVEHRCQYSATSCLWQRRRRPKSRPSCCHRTSLQNMQTQALLNQQRLTNAQSAIQANARQEREVSTGSDTKRRRPTGSIGPLPTASSNLGRQGSIGPGTPKPSTPGSRAGSVGPRPQKNALTVKKAKPQQPLRKAALTAKSGVNKKRRKGGSRASPSTTADDESVASEAGTEDEDMSGVGGGDAEEDESDDTKYCTCQRVSFGDMVACDNDNCRYQWFHWECVGIKEEPLGDWLCPECRNQAPSKIKRAR
jgi:inhibitor of growth protein 3